MRYHNITHDDMLNGSGLRVVLWVSGCVHHCKDCQNPITWNHKNGLIFDDSAMDEIRKELEKDYVSGLTLSGGDPLHHRNVSEVYRIVKTLKEEFPSKTIWLYTGHTWEHIFSTYNLWSVDVKNILKYVDVLVDGQFKRDLLSPDKPWVGSSNQRVIDVKRSLNGNKIVLWGADINEKL